MHFLAFRSQSCALCSVPPATHRQTILHFCGISLDEEDEIKARRVLGLPGRQKMRKRDIGYAHDISRPQEAVGNANLRRFIACNAIKSGIHGAIPSPDPSGESHEIPTKSTNHFVVSKGFT
eukprot:Skav213683  [mRNA]  locus=scaffold491:383840:384414:- [translate_table: standard]